MTDIRSEVLRLKDWLIEVRRAVHRHPELGYDEVQTAALVERALREFGLEVRTGLGRTGVVGLWRADRPGPVLGLRADMDALPVTEPEGRDWCSRVPGVMHACGHDMHTAMLLGAARFFAEAQELKTRLKGAVKFIFQPAEEGGGGAPAMIADGVLTDPPMDAIFAAHVVPPLETGRAGYRHGVAMASVDNFRVHINGRGGHAAHPDLAADPVAPAARLLLRIKENTAELDQTLTAVTMFQAGTMNNIIPETAALEGTIRSLSQEGREAARNRVKAAAVDLEKETGLRVNVRLEAGYPMLVNHRDMTDLLVRAAGRVLGPENVVEQGPSFGAEDMAYFLAKVPGAQYWLGCGCPGQDDPAMLHSPDFDPDEDCLPIGVEIMVRLAESVLV